MTTLCKDSKGRWCARVLAPETCGTRWLVLEGDGDLADLIAGVEFVFTGSSTKKRPIEIAGSSDDIQKCVEDGMENAVLLDNLIKEPPWIRQAVANEMRVDRRTTQAKMRNHQPEPGSDEDE